MKKIRETENVCGSQIVYQAPVVEVIEVEVENGFAVSGEADDFESGN